MNTKSNRYEHAELIAQRIQVQDGRWGTVTSAGFGLISVDLDCGWWLCGPAWAILK